MYKQLLVGLIVGGFVSSSAAAGTSSFEIDPSNIISGITARSILVDGNGADWTSAVMRIDLTQGSIYNAPDTDPNNGSPPPHGGEIIIFPPLTWQWDTYVGILNDAPGGIAGGAGDLGCGAQSYAGTGACAVSSSWFNTDVTDTGPVQIGNISLTNDAVGTWQLIVRFADGNIESSGIIVPEPGSLALLGLGVMGVFWRRQFADSTN